MILFANGCSWTWGGGLEGWFENHEERLKLLWPHHLGNKIGADKVINLAEGCGSNQRIVRTTFDWLASQSKEDLENTIAIIQFTEPSRYEYYQPSNSNDENENFSERWIKAKANCILGPNESNPTALMVRSNDLRIATYTEIDGIYLLLRDCLALEALFKKYNVKYYFWSFVNRIYAYPDHFKEYFLNNFPWIDNGYHYDWKYEPLSPTDNHPSINGHIQLSEIIHAKIKEYENIQKTQ